MDLALTKGGEGYMEIAKCFHLGICTVRNVIKKWKLRGTVEVKKNDVRKNPFL